MKSDPMLDAAIASPPDPLPSPGLVTNPIPTTRVSEDDLLAAIRANELRAAVGLAAKLHGAAIGRFAMSLLGSQADAEEVVQETLLSAYTAFPQYRAEGSVRAFLFTIARRTVARTLEARSRRNAKAEEERADEVAVSAEVDLSVKQRAVRVRKALEQLRPSEREAVMFRYGTECSFREVAEACGCEEAAARQRVSRAVKHLRDLLKDEETP